MKTARLWIGFVAVLVIAVLRHREVRHELETDIRNLQDTIASKDRTHAANLARAAAAHQLELHRVQYQLEDCVHGCPMVARPAPGGCSMVVLRCHETFDDGETYEDIEHRVGPFCDPLTNPRVLRIP